MGIHFESFCYNDFIILLEKDLSFRNDDDIHLQICSTCRTVKDRLDAGQDGCRTYQIQDKSDAGQDGCRTRWMQDRTDAVRVQDGCRTG